MNNLLDYIKVYRKILDKETCNKIIQEKDLKFFPATTQGRVVSHRQCLIKKLNPEFESIIKFKVIEITNRYMKDYPHLITGFENKVTRKNNSHSLLRRNSIFVIKKRKLSSLISII